MNSPHQVPLNTLNNVLQATWENENTRVVSNSAELAHKWHEAFG